MAGLFQSGADVPLSYGFNTPARCRPGLTSGGVALSYTIAANLITATAGRGPTVFTMALDASTGAWTFTLVRPLDHPSLDGLAGDNTENDLTIEFGGLVQATDQDGDTVTATGTVTRSGRRRHPDGGSRHVDRHGRRGQAAGRHRRRGTGDVDAGAGTAGLVATGSVTGLFQSGADVPLSYGFNTAGTLPAGLTSGGVALSYVVTAEPDHGDGRCCGADGVHDGARRGDRGWTFTLAKPLDHPTLDGWLATTPRTTCSSTSAAWCRRPTATATR